MASGSRAFYFFRRTTIRASCTHWSFKLSKALSEHSRAMAAPFTIRLAPQPLANAGILYLERWITESTSTSDFVKANQAKYPGQIGEVVQEMDVWQSAVTMLTERKMVDPDKIGIIGFSRGGWYAEFMLAHSLHSFRGCHCNR